MYVHDRLALMYIVQVHYVTMSGILRQWPLKLYRKTAKLLNMAPILPILKILQK